MRVPELKGSTEISAGRSQRVQTEAEEAEAETVIPSRCQVKTDVAGNLIMAASVIRSRRKWSGCPRSSWVDELSRVK